MRLNRRKALLVVLLLAATVATTGYHRYRGMARGMWHHMWHASIGESWNLTQCILYWLAYMEKLEQRPDGFYDFPAQDGDARGTDACALAFHRGTFARAIDCLETDIAARGPSERRLFWLGMSYQRLAEEVNCLEPLQAGDAPAQPTHTDHGTGLVGTRHEHQAYCTLPLRRHHDREELSQQAIAAFTQLLDDFDSDNRLYQWLLAFSAMTIDAFPEGIPERYRIDTPFIDHFYGDEARRTAAQYPHLRFRDRAAALGVDTLDTGRGVAIEDFDRDGDLDLVTGGSFHVVRYYANQGGDRGFTERTDEVGLEDVRQPFAISAADYDNDGWVDLFVGRPFDAYRLFRNQQGHFVDVTEETGLLAPKRPEQVAATWVSAWGDIDNDGDLDLFLAQWNFRMPLVGGLMGKTRMDPILFRNEGGQGFVDATEAWDLRFFTRDQYYIGATFGDVDGDGFTDLYLSSPLRGTSVLLRNDQGRRFVRSDATDRDESGFVTAMLDIDHDGRLDIFQSGFSEARSSIEQTVFGEHAGHFRTGRSTILHQNADGRFEERNDFFDGARWPMSTMGSSYGDLDNDGCFDFYLGTGNPEGWFVLPNMMYVGQRDGRRCTGHMKSISMLEGFGTVQKGHGIVFFDFDDDGDQDVYSSLGGMWPSDGWPNQLFVNESTLENSWVKLRLRGRRSNRFGVGARITVTAVATSGDRIVRRHHMDNKTGFGSAPYLAHIGLLDATSIERVEVHWPASGCTTTYDDVALHALTVLDEATCSTRG